MLLLPMLYEETQEGNPSLHYTIEEYIDMIQIFSVVMLTHKKDCDKALENPGSKDVTQKIGG